jgi:catechol 2,3-dioxygenase-like lactoylglutathione lyase family enzyme
MDVVVQGQFDGAQYAEILNLQEPRGRVALLKGAGLQLELFEFAHPVPKPGDAMRPVCDHGITHFCIEVMDIDREYKRFVEAGVVFHCKPLTFKRTGNKATYGRDPDGNVFELLETRP